ncbi:hypothetical protein [Streptomyces sp. NPDC012888]|uniref:hypothetical protein n=1 Tax=Streptomyces sp. NPDC012888 TaxID=3364855 RepID=UPI00369AA520
MNGCPHDVDICPGCGGVRTHRWKLTDSDVETQTLSDGTQIWDETYTFTSLPDPCDSDPTT